MIVLWLVRCSETNISSATETRDSRMISTVNGSIRLSTAMSYAPVRMTRLPPRSSQARWPG